MPPTVVIYTSDYIAWVNITDVQWTYHDPLDCKFVANSVPIQYINQCSWNSNKLRTLMYNAIIVYKDASIIYMIQYLYISTGLRYSYVHIYIAFPGHDHILYCSTSRSCKCPMQILQGVFTISPSSKYAQRNYSKRNILSNCHRVCPRHLLLLIHFRNVSDHSHNCVTI